MPESDWYYKQIQDATLEVIERGNQVQVFNLRKYPGRSMMSTVLVFLPFCIILTGDNRVCNHGVQALGYALEWFKNCHEASYLAEKFLETKWVPEKAEAYWKGILADYKQQFEEWKSEAEPDDPPDNKLFAKMNWRAGYNRQLLFGVTIVQALGLMLEDSSCFESPDALYCSLPAWHNKSDGFWHCPFDTSCGLGGYGYAPGEVGWLAAIQKRFAELYPLLPPF